MKAPKTTLRELATLFTRLGATAFGGPAAHIAMMEDEVVRRRNWLSQAEFLDLLGATNLIPGPNSTEMAIHIGYRRAGWPGLIVAGCCFILPAALIVSAIAWSYLRFGKLPQAEGLLYGVKPVIIAVVAQALWGLGRTAIKSVSTGAVVLAVIALSLAGAHEIALLFAAGLVLMVGAAFKNQKGPAPKMLFPLDANLPSLPPLFAAAATTASAGAVASFSLAKLFWFFFKTGSILFGSGYVLLAFIRADLVERWGWLTEAQLLDAIAIGQITPGPVFTTATFIGCILGGAPGAVLATVGIFLPAFIFVALSGPLVPRLRESRLAGAFLDGVNAASLALMAVVTWQLASAALIDWLAFALLGISAALLFRYRVNSAWLVAGGAAAGIIRALVV